MVVAEQEDYEIMKNHKILWHYQFQRRNMRYGFKFWCLCTFMMVSLSMLSRAIFREPDVIGMVGTMTQAYCQMGGVTCYVASFIHHRQLYPLVDKLQRHFDSHKQHRKNREILQACYGEADRMFRIISYILVMNWVLSAVTPLMNFGLQLASGQEAVMMLPFKAVYPWEVRGVTFLLSYFLQIVVWMLVISMVIVNVATPTTCAMAIVASFKITQERYKEIDENKDDLGKMKIAIKSHQETLKLVQDVQRVEGVKFFFQIFTTALGLSTCVFRLTKAESIETVLSFMSLTLSLVAHLFVICHYGQKVIDEGHRLFAEVSSVPWYSQSLPFRHNMCLCLMRSAKVVKLTGWNFADLSFEIFNVVMTTSFSYLTFIQTMSE